MPKMMKSYRPEELIQILHDVAAELGRTPKRMELVARARGEHPQAPHLIYFKRVFGSVAKAFEAAGLKPLPRKPGSYIYSLEEAAKKLRAFALKLGHLPIGEELRRQHRRNRYFPSSATFVNLFGSLQTAYDAAGISHLPARPKREMLDGDPAPRYRVSSRARV